VAGSNGSDTDRRDTGPAQASPPSVDGIQVDPVDIEVHKDAGKAGPPDRNQFTVRPDTPDEPSGGDQPFDFTVILPAASRDLTAGALGVPGPMVDPVTTHPSRVGGPGGEACSTVGPRRFTGLEDYPGGQVGESVVVAGSECNHQVAGLVGGVTAASTVAYTPVTAGAALRRGATD
jgi:hypothetical protein